MTTAVASRPKSTGSSGPKVPERRYSISDDEFNRVIKKTIFDSLCSPVNLGEKHEVRLKPEFDTACWSYQPPHKIYVGTDLFEKRQVKLGLPLERQEKYIANHYHHELGHALRTERDMARIQAQLKTIKAPFGIFNLFEDANMEHWYSVTAEYQFEWLTMETLEFNARPESILFGLIQAEGRAEVVETALRTWTPTREVEEGFEALSVLLAPSDADARDELLAKFPKVLKYYERILAATHTLRLMPILRDWLDEFGRPPEMPNAGMADMGHSMALMLNPKLAQAFEESTKPVEASGKAAETADSDAGVSAKADKPDNAAAIAQHGNLLSHSTPVDLSRAELLANKFLKLFRADTGYASSSTPSKRLSVKHMVQGKPFYRRKVVSARGPRNIFLEIDCSGSMGGFHIMEGKLLLTALNILARKGLVTGHVVLSGVSGGKSLWETFKFPMTQDCINRIQGRYGAEGLEYSLQSNIKLAKEADYVFVYTDGQICDREIDKSKLHTQGIYTWGLYAGEDNSYLEELIKYFDKAILRKSADDLIDAILAQLK
jgi:hypothetical protein